MNWEIGIDIYTLICIKWITNKNLLYKKINKIKLKTKTNKQKEWTQSVTIFVSHVNIHQRVSTMEGALNHQVNKMTLLVDTSQPLSSATPTSTQ